MSKNLDSIRKRISDLRTQKMPYPDIVTRIEAEFPSLECWFTKAYGLITVFIEVGSIRSVVWTAEDKA